MVYNDYQDYICVFFGMANFSPRGMAKRYSYIQIDKEKDLNDMHSPKNVSGLEITAVPETTAF